MAEEFRFEQVGRQRGAVDGQEGFADAFGPAVNEAGKHLLAGAAFPLDQDRGVGGRDLFGGDQEPAHRITAADDPPVGLRPVGHRLEQLDLRILAGEILPGLYEFLFQAGEFLVDPVDGLDSPDLLRIEAPFRKRSPFEGAARLSRRLTGCFADQDSTPMTALAYPLSMPLRMQQTGFCWVRTGKARGWLQMNLSNCRRNEVAFSPDRSGSL